MRTARRRGRHIERLRRGSAMAHNLVSQSELSRQVGDTAYITVAKNSPVEQRRVSSADR
jgi:hypothetical protein